MKNKKNKNLSDKGIVIEELKEPQLKIYAFDFINGAGAVVVSPEDVAELEEKPDLRKWMVYYTAGYCAFWQIENWEWLFETVDRVVNGELSDSGIKTAKYMCDKLKEEINGGREVDRFPKFYLCKNLE
ncbi:MAG: hypothetical protein J1F67_12560 [Muribaculaceae bacterium]|nr:hypothetical protein [Muribaculaceae bacterium]